MNANINSIKAGLQSRKSTVAGVCIFLIAVAHAILAWADDDPATVPDMAEIMGAITGLSLVIGRFGKPTAYLADGTPVPPNEVPPQPPPSPPLPPLRPSGVGMLIVFLSVALALSGCTTATTRFSETVTDADGTTATTEYRASSTAAPLGKLDTTGHQWVYDWGAASGNHIGTGQQASGLDNNGQAVLVPLVQSLIDGLLKMVTQLQAQAAANAVTASTDPATAIVGAVNVGTP